MGKIGLVASIFVTLFLLGTICMAQPGGQQPMVPVGPACQVGYHFDYNTHTCIPDSPTPQTCQVGYHFDYNTNTCVPDSPTPQGNHPATGPATSQPTGTPSASTGKVLSSFGEGQELTSNEVVAAFGSEPQKTNANSPQEANANSFQLIGPLGIQYWAFYNGFWTQGPSAVWFGQQMNTPVYNDQAQNIWGYELYPNSVPKWYYWGYRMPGYINSFFFGDMRGWHECAIWGDKSGWSNVLWIYVW